MVDRHLGMVDRHRDMVDRRRDMVVRHPDNTVVRRNSNMAVRRNNMETRLAVVNPIRPKAAVSIKDRRPDMAVASSTAVAAVVMTSTSNITSCA